MAPVLVAGDVTDGLNEVRVHRDPAWRARANFIIVADIRESDAPPYWEQMWAKQVGPNRFELCCIPFFVYNLAPGDLVETGDNPDNPYVIERVVQHSGHYTFRAWFGHASEPGDGIKIEVVDAVVSMGAEVEWSSRNLLAIDAPSTEVAQQVEDYLYGRHERGELIYERGRTV